MTGFTLFDLERIIAQRAGESPDVSYTAKLYSKGIAKAAEKLGEEAVETIIAAVSLGSDELTDEAADLLYHLLVVLRLGKVELGDVLHELEQRTRQSGLEEKAARRDHR